MNFARVCGPGAIFGTPCALPRSRALSNPTSVICVSGLSLTSAVFAHARPRAQGLARPRWSRALVPRRPATSLTSQRTCSCWPAPRDDRMHESALWHWSHRTWPLNNHAFVRDQRERHVPHRRRLGHGGSSGVAARATPGPHPQHSILQPLRIRHSVVVIPVTPVGFGPRLGR